ncbi:WbqC family protein [Adhaeribacter aquaticus]|uniref:WbqC family protein n=1 Tax=Adhaeribacter aquaticus TaxID=299567 RepID=UPI0004104A8F|nr:WbqC family protein [Adhaeribacter aquaticus]
MIFLTEIQYNPSVTFFQHVLHAEKILIEQHEHYIKQSYRNRCRILTAHGPKDLAIPVKKGNRKTKITELEIDYSQNWVNIHWRSICSAYGSAPFFTYYNDYIQQIYEQKIPLLFQLDLAFLRFYLKCLNIKKPVIFTDTYMPAYATEVADYRNKIHPKLNSAILDIKPYNQVFGKQFVPDLSIIDVLFSQGPEALSYLEVPLPPTEHLP